MAQVHKCLLAAQLKDELPGLNSESEQAPTSKAELKAAEGPPEHNSIAKPTVKSDGKPRRSRRAKSRVKKKKEKEAKSQAKEESTRDSALKCTSGKADRLSETERKAELAKAIEPTLVKGKVRRVNAKEPSVARKITGLVVRNIKGNSSPKRKEPASTISKTPGFDSLKDSLIGGSTKSRNNIEKADATKLKILRETGVDLCSTKANCLQPLLLTRPLYRSCRMAWREFYSSELPMCYFYRYILILCQSGHLPASRP